MADSTGMVLGLSFGLGVIVGLGLGMRIAPVSGSGYQSWLLQQREKQIRDGGGGGGGGDGVAVMDGEVAAVAATQGGRNGYNSRKQTQPPQGKREIEEREGAKEGSRCSSIPGSVSGSVDTSSFYLCDRSLDMLLDDPPEFDLREERKRWSINPLFVQQAPAMAVGGEGGGGGGEEVRADDGNSRIGYRNGEEVSEGGGREELGPKPVQSEEREREREGLAQSKESPAVIFRRLKHLVKQVEATLQRADLELEALKRSLPRRLCPPLRGLSPDLLASIRAAFLPKLLIMDVSGFLVHRCFKKEYNNRLSCVSKGKPVRPPDGVVGQFYVWERAHGREFIRWAQANFTVGVWSSALQRNLHGLLEHLMGENPEESFSFVWDQSMCTSSGLKHPENRHKPIFFKELSKVWACEELVGLYNETNTLLLDDSPYKVIKNPPFTSIHPPEYVGNDKGDNALGEGGLIREELKRYKGAASVQAFARMSQLAAKAAKMADLSAQLARAQLALLAEQHDQSLTPSEGTITPESSQDDGSCNNSTNGSSRSASRSGTPRHPKQRVGGGSLDGSLPPFRAGGGVLRRLSLKETSTNGNVQGRASSAQHQQPKSPIKPRAAAKLREVTPFL